VIPSSRHNSPTLVSRCPIAANAVRSLATVSLLGRPPCGHGHGPRPSLPTAQSSVRKAGILSKACQRRITAPPANGLEITGMGQFYFGDFLAKMVHNSTGVDNVKEAIENTVPALP
jgi:hypothetical protein